MKMGIGPENGVKLTRHSSRKTSPVTRKKFPGRVSSAIVLGQTVIYFTVDRHRKDYEKVEAWDQKLKGAKLPTYEQSLFNSCFKKWGVGNVTDSAIR